MATREEFKAIFGFEPPEGAVSGATPDTQPAPAKIPLADDRPATPEERRLLMDIPAPPKPPPPEAVNALKTPFWKTGATEHGGEPVPMFPKTREAVTNAVTGDSSVAYPAIGPFTPSGLGLGGGPDAGFWTRVMANATDPRALRMLAQAMTSRDPAAMERVIAANVPEAKFATDPQGKRIVQVPGHPPMYLDRGGVMDPSKAAFYAPQTAVALAQRGKSIPGMVFGNVVQDAASTAASHAVGGEQEWIDPTSLAATGGITAGLGLAGKALVQGGKAGYNYITGQLDNLPGKEEIRAAARRLLAKEFGHQPTLGQVTGNPYQIKKEDILLNAKASPTQAARLSDLHAANVEANEAAKTGVIAEASGATRLTPGKPPVVPPNFQADEARFGTQILDNVRAKHEALSTAESKAWDALGGGSITPTSAAGRSVEFTQDVTHDTLGRAFRTALDNFGQPMGPNGAFTAGQLRNGGQSIRDALDVLKSYTVTPTGTTGFNLGHYRDMRQQLENVIQSAPTPNIARIVRKMKGDLDDAVAAAERNGQIVGDPQTLAAFREANRATRDKHAFLNPKDNDAAQSFLEQATHQVEGPGGAKAYSMTGQEAVDRAFGSGNIVDPGGGTMNILRHFSTHLGNDSPAIQAARGVVVKRPLYGRARSPGEEGTEIVTGPQYGSTAQRLQQQLRGSGKEVTEQLLPLEMRVRLAGLKDAMDTLNRSYTPMGPRQNTSGSAYFLQGVENTPLPAFLRDMLLKYGAGKSIDKAIAGGQGRVLAIPAGPTPGVAPAARVGGLLGSEAFIP
jgi:hypothetical protein